MDLATLFGDGVLTFPVCLDHPCGLSYVSAVAPAPLKLLTHTHYCAHGVHRHAIAVTLHQERAFSSLVALMWQLTGTHVSLIFA